MNILKIYRMLKKSAGLAILLLGYMLPGVVAAESVHGRVTFVGTIGEFREPTGVFHAQFRFRVSESTCSITIRGVLLAGKFRTQGELDVMSADNQRNTLIVEMTGRTNKSVGYFQAMDNATLAGAGAVLVFIREAGIRDDQAIRTMSDDDLRNTLIVVLETRTNLQVGVLQGMTNVDLVLLGLGRKDRWIHVRSGRMDGKFQHNSANFRNAYNGSSPLI